MTSHELSLSNRHFLQVNMACYGQKPPDFLALQPNGQIPVAVIDGTVLRCGFMEGTAEHGSPL